MTDGNWPDPNRPGEPEDVTKSADYWLSDGPLGTPIAYSWVPAHGTVAASWWIRDPGQVGNANNHSPLTASKELYFRGAVRPLKP